MSAKIEGYRRYLFTGIIIIALGIIFTTTMTDVAGTLGTVFIAVGGLLFIIGMRKKNNEGKDSR